jgi:hypothetical protein
MIEDNPGKEEIVRDHITKNMPEFCGFCLKRKIRDCDFAEQPDAIERCEFVRNWFETEMAT